MTEPTLIAVRLDKHRLLELANNIPEAADRIVAAMALEVLADSNASFNTGPAGITYTRGNISHTASAPPGPPNTDTGNLRASGFTNQVKQAVWQVGYMADYADDLEMGTPFIAPRPFLTPALFRLQQKFAEKFRGLFR